MLVVEGKDDGLAHHVAVVNAQTLSHEVIEHAAHGVYIIDIFENLVWVNVARCRFVWIIRVGGSFGLLILPHFFQLLLFLITERIIAYASVDDGTFLAHLAIGNEEAVFDGAFQWIVGCRNAIFEVKKFVGGFVHIFARCGSQAEQ